MNTFVVSYLLCMCLATGPRNWIRKTDYAHFI